MRIFLALAFITATACQRASTAPTPRLTSPTIAPATSDVVVGDFCGLDPPSVSGDVAPSARADIYARRFSLPPLTADGEPELRLWQKDYMMEGMYALVIKGDRITRYFASNERGKSSPKITSKIYAGPPPVFAIMDQLRTLDGVSWSCMVMDGAGSVVDGRANGRRFTFSESNGADDEGPRGKLLRKLHELIGLLPE